MCTVKTKNSEPLKYSLDEELGVYRDLMELAFLREEHRRGFKHKRGLVFKEAAFIGFLMVSSYIYIFCT
eukprot:gene2490-3199_t